MNSQNKQNGLRKTLSRFADVIAGIGALFFAPYVTSNFREPMYEYLLTGFDYTIAQLGSWAFVALVIAGAFFGASMLLQIIIHSLVRLTTNKPSF